MKQSKSVLDVLVRRRGVKRRKVHSALPLHDRVEVLTDRYGIPHIFAGDEHDLAMVFGYIQAEDRLWQMETIRRLASGRLSEIVGPSTVDVDHWVRLTGFPSIGKYVLARMDESVSEIFEAFVLGINSYIAETGNRLPLEFKASGASPEPWKLEDLAAPLAYFSWSQQTNYTQELLAVAARENMSESLWRELFPPYSSGPYQHEPFFERYGNLKFGNFIKPSLALSPDLSEMIGGSNNWVVRDHPDGPVFLANDPHLGVSIPPVWYTAHLSCPGNNEAGMYVPGNPLIILGRNEQVAWGVTTAMIDSTDLIAFRVDPEHPTRYFLGDELVEMTTRTELITVRGEAQREVTVYETIHGPVITQVERGVEAVAVLKWYGTLPAGAFDDTSLAGFHQLGRSKTVHEAIQGAKKIAMMGLNYVIGDSSGNIGRYTSGRVPLRHGYRGYLPADGSGGEGAWDGFVPAEEMPTSVNPLENRIVTANHKIVDDDYPYRISDTWCVSYRYDRINELLDDADKPSIALFQRMQADVYSKQAESIVPAILTYSYSDEKAVIAVGMLEGWDYKVTRESRAALIYEVFLVRFVEELTEGLLGRGISTYLFFMGYLQCCLELLKKTETGDAVAHKNAPELLQGRSLQSVCEKALAGTMDEIEAFCGDDRKAWVWGRFHRYYFRHAGATSRLTSWLLNRGPYPADGDHATVNVAIPRHARRTHDPDQYEIRHLPSMRFITSMAGTDDTYVVLPTGQSGRPGTSHYADMMPLYLKGKQARLPLSREGAEAVAVSKAVFRPGPR